MRGVLVAHLVMLALVVLVVVLATRLVMIVEVVVVAAVGSRSSRPPTHPYPPTVSPAHTPGHTFDPSGRLKLSEYITRPCTELI